MARTPKTADTAEGVVVPLRPEIDDQQLPVDGPEVPCDDRPDETAAPRSGSRGPALNRVELIGRVARAPEIRVTPSGMHVAYFRVGTNGREERDTEFHQCTAFGTTAEFIGEYLGLGRLVHVDGRLQTRSYDDRHGVRRWVTTIVVNRLQVLDQRRRDEE